MNLNYVKEGALADAIIEKFENEDAIANSPIIKLDASHNILTTMQLMEIRFDKTMPIGKVKDCLEYKFGSPAKNQTLHLKDETKTFVVEMIDNNKTLEEYGAKTGFHLYCIDNDPSELIQGFDDLSTVEKYVISDEKYNERENTFRNFKK